MRRFLACGLLLATAAFFLPPAGALAKEDPEPGALIAWVNNLPKAFEQAKAERKVLMICINSRVVDGGRVEPAARMLREEVYLEPRIVKRSRDFVCCLLVGTAGSEDFGELRHRFGIDGLVVSPQHIFSHPDHQTGKPLVRLEYWNPRGKAKSVARLLELMDEAETKYRAQETLPDAPADGQPPAGDAPGAGVGAAPGAEAARAEWIAELITKIRTADPDTRQQALQALIVNDKEGDCIQPLVALLDDVDFQHDVAGLVLLVRALGRPELEAAVAPMTKLLAHKDAALRANAAVSLEYIGSPTASDELLKRMKAERDPAIANHLARALGRCGAGESKVRQALTKQVKGAKEEVESYGAIVGLAYFEGDKKAARAVEKVLQKVGPPSFGRRGSWGRGGLQRAYLSWCLAHIGDPKSDAFIEKKMISSIKNNRSQWMQPVLEFYRNVQSVVSGDRSRLGDVDEGLRRSMSFAGGNELHDDARKDRDTSRFQPKADWEVEAWRGGGGGRPPGGGGNDQDGAD